MKYTAETIKVGYFEHWTRPDYKFVDFLKEEGYEITKIDYSKKNYLEGYDVVFVEQNGFNDYIENDEEYIRDWVYRGGLFFFMHQSYERWAPYFLPDEVGYTQLIHRHVRAIGQCGKASPNFHKLKEQYRIYMMPWVEDAGKKLFNVPEVIAPDEMIAWEVPLSITTYFRKTQNPDEVPNYLTSAESCFLLPENWEILGSYADPAVRDGALVAKAKYGKGEYFVNQILFPEVQPKEDSRCLAFWKKYIKNLWAYFARFKNGESEEFAVEKKNLPIKKSYKLCTHMHSLDWYGCDSHPGTINAMMRYKNFDICSIAVKDNAPFKGHLDADKYSDDKVLMLHGQEYHPFNWGDKWDHVSHNGYHILAIGMNGEDYTTKFTCSRFGDEEAQNATREAVDYIHKSGGVACATHPQSPYWLENEYNLDAVDIEPLVTLEGKNVEKYWLSGKKVAMMVSVDLFGFARLLTNPSANVIYLKGKEPNRDNVCQAIRDRNTIAICGFDECDITAGEILPGDVVSLDALKNSEITISAKIMKNFPEDTIKAVRVYSADKVIWSKTDINEDEINYTVPLKDYELDRYVRVEIEGTSQYHMCTSTPFFIEK